jgi:hypothetical protein
METWSYPIACLFSVGLGWGIAWCVSNLIDHVAPALSPISFYAIGDFWTIAGIRSLLRHLMLQHRLRREANGETLWPEANGEFPQGWTPTRRRRGYLFNGLFWIAVAVLIGYFAPAPESTSWGWICGWVVSFVAVFGLSSIAFFFFGSDERILTSLSRKPPLPRE